MTNLPDGWTITEPTDPYDPHIVRRDGVPMANIRIRSTVQYNNGDPMTGQWEWHGLEGAGDYQPWTESGFHDFDDAVDSAVKRLAGV